MQTLGSVQGSLEAPATCKNGHLVNMEVSEACFSCFFFSGILINPFYFCLFCFPIYLFNKNKHIHDTKYVHMAKIGINRCHPL